MHIFHLIFDHQTAATPDAPWGTSLLTTAFGTSTLLDYVMRRAADSGATRATVVPLFEPPAGYSEQVCRHRRHDIKVVTAADSQEWLRGLEPSDWLLVTDPRCWPVDAEYPLAHAEDEIDYGGATYWIAKGAEKEAAREIIQHDEDGNVRTIMRCFGPVTGASAVSSTIPYALVPVWSVSDLSIQSLSQLRRSLLDREVTCRDIPLHADVRDLMLEENLLSLHDRILVQEVSRQPPRGYSRLESGVIMGQGAQIHSTARIVPPVVIQDFATIERGATVIGPTVIARGSRVGANAFIARSIVPFSMVIPPAFAMCHYSTPGFVDGAELTDDDSADRLEASAERAAHGHEDGAASSIHESRSRIHLYPALQRSIDFLVAAVSLILLSPLFLILAIWIKLDSSGPILFAHEREGRGGKRFRCFKFRSMRVNAHELQRELYNQNMVDGPQFKMPNDPRITRAGRYLRDHNLDELPQLFNVLLGHMSLVGPRPSPFRENQICIPWRRARLSVRPGITGLWQVCRTDRAAGDFQQWIYYDMVYVRHQSLWLDFKILLATVLTLGGRWEVPLTRLVRADGHH